MSKGLRYDAFLVRALAASLDARLGGRRIRALRFAPSDRSIVLAFRDDTLTWTLHPDRGWLTLEPRRTAGAGVGLPGGARLGRAVAPPDERLITIDIDGDDAEGGHVRRVVIELVGTHRNALALDAAGVVRAVLRPRPHGDRILAVGQPYSPLPAVPRLGAAGPPTRDEWRAALDVPADGRRQALLARVAYTGPINADWLLAGGDVDAGYDRYVAMVATRDEAWLLASGTAPQPYPARLGDDGARREADLLAAFGSAAALRLGTADADAHVARTAAALETVRARLDRAALRIARLEEEARGAPEEAAALRRQADLLLAQLHRVPRGAAAADLDDFEGGIVTVQLDPAATPADNATRLYDAARKRERANERVPRLLRAARRERDRLAALHARIETGQATAEELAPLAAREKRPGARDQAPTLPYRVYRTSGGLEVRVGRSNRANDDLTFHHSAPDDVWLHADSVPGAHVVLRWGRRDGNPPAADLHEAAVLAAVHSRARTSGTVPVTWTRRKYVRKPRKAPAGAVTVERGRTVFVEPSAELERRLR